MWRCLEKFRREVWAWRHNLEITAHIRYLNTWDWRTLVQIMSGDWKRAEIDQLVVTTVMSADWCHLFDISGLTVHWCIHCPSHTHTHKKTTAEEKVCQSPLIPEIQCSSKICNAQCCHDMNTLLTCVYPWITQEVWLTVNLISEVK